MRPIFVLFCLALGLELSGCASQPMTSTSVAYARVDGSPINVAQEQAVLAQCQGEGASGVADYVTGEGAIPWIAGMATRSSKEATITNACMARNGYVLQQ